MSHYNNASLVGDSLNLFISGSGLAVSTLIQYGFWYGICKSPEVVSALAGRFDLSGTEENELHGIRASFCHQLAAVITSTEVALAGHLSPWPLELPWWQPLRFVGTAYVGYQTYTHQNPYSATIKTAIYFTHEVVARTVTGASAIRSLRKQNTSTIQPLDYARNEYFMLSSTASMLVGIMFYKKMLAIGSTSLEAAIAYLISAGLTETISAISYLPVLNSDSAGIEEKEAKAIAAAGSGAIAAAGSGAIAGSITTAISAAMVSWGRSDLSLNIAELITITLAIPDVRHLNGSEILIGTIAGTGSIQFLFQQSRILDSEHLMRNGAVTLAPALALALINGVSNNAVYGYSLEESLTETARTQWMKFYAPLDYLYTLFN
ncbi:MULTISPECIES: hypothetical protein [unclassified Endozoicomonas]|uniref:hypothetical protein n=1 Tax=unclassified Endozoicomonas TaxID=2644528 RepID=UPI00214910C3|nr:MULTISPECIES: hypothetical protein [unclassified Endozoicomonas]